MADYDPAADPVHGSGWNSAARWGGWDWREPRDGDHFRTCSFCGSIHPEDLAAMQAGSDTCRICGQQGWDACFRSQQPGWAAEAIRSGILSEEEHGQLAGKVAAHSYDPGGWYASWADQKYGWPHKFYAEGVRPREPERLHVISAHRDPTEGPYAPGGEHYTPIQERMPGLTWVPVSEIPEGTVTDGWRDLADRYDMAGLGARTTLHAKFYTMHLADPRIGDEVKEKIAQVCGLRFRFLPDGRVGWCPASDPPHEHDAPVG